ncbi:MAG: hypothetical protein HYZ26_05110 [Chloroflexi bacterium]|nr:hypothetical protein [Chloroflexota bacterium]
MPNNEAPDIRQLQKSGNVRALLGLLNHSRTEVKIGAAEALSSMDLKPGDRKKTHKQITKTLKRVKSQEAFTSIVPISIGVYRHSLISLESLSSTETLIRVYTVWFDVYLELLKQHKRIFGDRFRLAVDSDRIRHTQIEQIAQRVLTLAARSTDTFKDGKFQLRFIIETVGYLDQLVSLEGHKYLTMEGYEGDHDWTLSRSVYKKLCERMEEYCGQKFGWNRLRENIMALIMKGEIDLSNTPFLDTKHLSLIEKRTDLASMLPYVAAMKELDRGY